MSKIRIKKNIDLKELEKFGFTKSEELEGTYTYNIPDEVNNYQKIDLHINKYGSMALEMHGAYYGMQIPTIIFDLIKADLVEKE